MSLEPISDGDRAELLREFPAGGDTLTNGLRALNERLTRAEAARAECEKDHDLWKKAAITAEDNARVWEGHARANNRDAWNLQDENRALTANLAESEADCLEQCRLLGAGGSREAALLAKMAQAISERDQIEAQCADAERFGNEQEQRAIGLVAERDALKGERDEFDDCISECQSALQQAGVQPGGDGHPRPGINALVDQRDDARAERDALRAALAELVACKDLSDRIDAWHEDGLRPFQELVDLEAEYKTRKVLAWQSARVALAAEPGKGEGT